MPAPTTCLHPSDLSIASRPLPFASAQRDALLRLVSSRRHHVPAHKARATRPRPHGPFPGEPPRSDPRPATSPASPRPPTARTHTPTPHRPISPPPTPASAAPAARANHGACRPGGSCRRSRLPPPHPTFSSKLALGPPAPPIHAHTCSSTAPGLRVTHPARACPAAKQDGAYKLYTFPQICLPPPSAVKVSPAGLAGRPGASVQPSAAHPRTPHTPAQQPHRSCPCTPRPHPSRPRGMRPTTACAPLCAPPHACARCTHPPRCIRLRRALRAGAAPTACTKA